MAQIGSVQVLRGLAALAVVFSHTQQDMAAAMLKSGGAFALSFLLPWGAGVDLFFVISGFIMVYASQDLFGQRHAARDFLTRRLIRIAPLYWIFATLFLVVQIVTMKAGSKALVAPQDIIASYLFFPTDAFADGFARPFFTLGWTLNYEMFFYVVFASLLIFPRAIAALGVVSLLTIGVLAGAAIAPQSVAIAFWTQPIVLEFGLGALIAFALVEGARLPRSVALALIGGGVALLLRDFLGSAAQPLDWIAPNGFGRLLAWGVPAAMIVTGCVLGRFSAARATLPARAMAAGVKLGDASYALYLIHPFVVVLMRKAMLASGTVSTLGPWAAVAITLAASVVAALIVHRWLEKPLIRWLRAHLERPSARPHGSMISLRASA